MLILPFLYGMAASKATWLHLPLFICWLLLYLLS
ncbi:YwiC-like family protein [Paenibacillus sp. 1P07SE]